MAILESFPKKEDGSINWKGLRHQLDFSQTEIAKDIGINQGVWGQLERNESSTPQARSRRAICAWLSRLTGREIKVEEVFPQANFNHAASRAA